MKNSIFKRISIILCAGLIVGCSGHLYVYAEETVEEVISESYEGSTGESQETIEIETEITEPVDIETESDGTETDAIEESMSESIVLNTEESREETEKETEEETELKAPQEQAFLENSWRYENGFLIRGIALYSDTYKNAWKFENGFFVNNLGDPIYGAVTKGIDVSTFNGEIDWQMVADESDVDYAIIRCGYGNNYTSQDDRYWKRNADECTRLGIPFGTYIYSYAANVEEAKSEAEHVLRLIQGYDLSYPVYLDLEDAITEKLSDKEIADIAETFCNIVQNAGYEVGIYANLWWFNNRLTDSRFSRWEKWIAQYNEQCDYSGDFSMWQCTSSGSVPGITANDGFVDLNFDFKDRGIPKKQDGFVRVDSKIYYYKNGVKLKGRQEINGKSYRFDWTTGEMFTGETVENGHWVYYSERDGARAEGWTEHHGHRYYYGENGWMKYGRQTIAGKNYVFDSVTGVMVRNVEKVVDGHWVYYGSDGAMAIGWTEHHGHRYYYGKNGWMKYGCQTIDGKKYMFDSVTGVMITNAEKVVDGHWVYYGSDGAMAEGWTEHHGHRYYYGENGWMKYGHQTIDGKNYVFDSVTGVMARNVEKVVGGHWVYYGSDGVMATGWAEHHGHRYYYDENGWMKYGRQRIDGKNYFFDPVTGVMAKNVEKVVGGHWVYYGDDGAMATGWTEHHGHRYYYDENGWMKYGRQEIDGKVYNFHTVTGVLLNE